MACIVVARYNEDIDWTRRFRNVIIYNKGKRLDGDNIIPLKNVGREGHTYYTHIYNNYDNLDDYIIFVQGNPFDHSPNIISKIVSYNNIILLDFFYEKETNISFHFLSNRILDCKLSGCIHHPLLPLKKTYHYLFGEGGQKNKEFKFGAGAQFIVSKEQILKRPKEFYLKIIQLLETSKNPIEGFVIERFHGLIMGN